MRSSLSTHPAVEDPTEVQLLPPGGLEHMPDEQFNAELRAAGLLVSGSGGRGHDDPGDSGGGGGDGGDWGEDWGPRRHSGAVRVVALVTASFLILGTAGAWISIAFGAVETQFPANAVVLQVTGGSATSGARSAGTTPGAHDTTVRWTVGLSVANRTNAKADVVCVVSVEQGDHIGATQVGIGHMAPGATVNRMVIVPGTGKPEQSVPLTMAGTLTDCGPRMTNG